ncbi:TIM21-domain-containing protein [Cokeromyces recurvatus]|uniref:TIM21-domain-containing protein n=1 Tax=Cokeromyces recurvatus TaxID=90255 RepID=UPI00221FFC3C|nr:TIM21-domain-containing protein [Cokeromyces recurvatus]KAI7904324.1 TIM21-domain-containing protein [Cokeromyces recurvatus]
MFRSLSINSCKQQPSFLHFYNSKLKLTTNTANYIHYFSSRQFSTPVRYTPKKSNNNSGLAAVVSKPWSELSTPQKVVRASKTTVNVGVILTGVALTSAIVYYVGSELFSSQSTTSIFSNAVDRIRDHEGIVSVLGEPIKAHGEPSRNGRRRNRRIASQIVEDRQQQPHLFMRFYVEGPKNQGTVMVEMIKDEKNKWEYKQLFVDIPGQGLPSKRIYLEQH